MGFRHLVRQIEKDLKTRKEQKDQAVEEAIERGQIISEFFKSDEYKIIKEVCKSLEENYLKQAKKNRDLSMLVKAEAFDDVRSVLQNIVMRAKTLSASKAEQNK